MCKPFHYITLHYIVRPWYRLLKTLCEAKASIHCSSCGSMLGLVGQAAWHLCVECPTVSAISVALAAFAAQGHRVGEVDVHSIRTPWQVHSLIDHIPEVAGLLGVRFQGALEHRVLSTQNRNINSHFMHLANALIPEQFAHFTFFQSNLNVM